ncbi:MAG: hypothetical protein SF182_27170 [Deltaproteobacteria bacterium]|nr:hypothetical protein [Deltaproteobacteria bacterium]
MAVRSLKRRGVGTLRRLCPVLVVPAPLQRLVQSVVARSRQLPLGPPLPPTVLVFDARAVARVLADYHTFPVRPLYGAKMRETFGPFLLGLDYEDPADPGAKSYQEQIALVRAAVGQAAIGPLTEAARRAASAAIGAAAPAGRLNVVAMLQTAMRQFLDEYFGIPEIAGGSETLLQLNQRTASYVFNIELFNPGRRADAAAAGQRILDHLTALFEAKLRQPSTNRLPFVDALVHAANGQWTARQLATVTGGTISGLLVPTTAQFLAVVDHLLDLPPAEYDRLCATASVRSAAIARHAADEDDGRLARYIAEASRFEPFPTGLQRQCDERAAERERTVETGGGRRTVIPAGAIVMALVGAAACDPRLAPRPGAFAIARGDDEYLLFGTGQHHCVGATRHWPVAQTLMTEMATALFSLPQVRRAPGRDGLRTTPKGTQWPTHLFVTWSAGRAR